MIRELLRAPVGPAQVTADVLRVMAAISIVVAGIGWGLQGALSLAAAFAALLLPRLLRLPPGFDIAFGAATLVACWSSVTDLYFSVRWWDLPMHFLTNGVWAALLYVVLVRSGTIAGTTTLRRPRLSTAVMTTALGLSIAVLWELFEWAGHTFVDSRILVGYRDSIGDMVAGGLGSLLAGLGMRTLLGGDRDLEGAGSPEAIGRAERPAAPPM